MSAMSSPVSSRYRARSTRPPVAARARQFVDLLRPPVRNCCSDAGQDGVAGDAVELHVAAGGKVRKSLLDCVGHLFAGAAEQRPEPPVEAELAPMETDEIKNGAHRLALVAPQPTPKLLQEQDRTIGRSQQKQGVDIGKVDTFVEEVYGEQHVDLAVSERVESRAPFDLGWNPIPPLLRCRLARTRRP